MSAVEEAADLRNIIDRIAPRRSEKYERMDYHEFAKKTNGHRC